jgi:hypothetical protein
MSDDMNLAAMNPNALRAKAGLSDLWECWVAYDWDDKIYGVFPSEIEALRFAVSKVEYYLRVKQMQPGSVEDQLK